MPNILDLIEQNRKKVQDEIKVKMENGKELTDYEVANYQLTDDDVKAYEFLRKIVDGEDVGGLTLKDFLATPQAKVLIPRVIIGTARKAMDPIYLASKFFKEVKVKSGNVTHFPTFGVMRAHDVAEGQEIPQETIDWYLNSDNLIHIGKVGLRLQFTDDILNDTEFDIVGMMTSEAGRAMARHAEQKAFTEWLMHGHTLFDNKLRAMNPIVYAEAGTTGVDFVGNENDTLSIDDFLDVVIAAYNNGYTPSDFVMHPLVWTVFARNGLTGSLTAPMDREAHRETGSGSFKLGPEAVQGKIPFALTANLSPFAPIDKEAKTFDFFCVDRNNVGVKLVRDKISTEEFRDPSRDIRNIKLVERYGYGIHDKGRAIIVAKNISMAKSWPMAERVINITPTP